MRVRYRITWQERLSDVIFMAIIAGAAAGVFYIVIDIGIDYMIMRGVIG